MKCFLHFTLLAFTVISACGNNPQNNQQSETAKNSAVATKAGYNFEKVERCEMKKKLNEISGLINIKDDLFVAIQDESGKIFTLNYSTCDITDEMNFAGKGDYEDITLDGEFYYVLESMGKIYRVPRNGDISRTKTYEIPSKKQLEFESLYIDSKGENLVMICKDCPGKKNNSLKNGYAFNIKKETFANDPAFGIDVGDKDLKPSAAAINPIDKKLYVLCSVGKSLLVCDLSGKIEKINALNPAIYGQPEGIAFTPNGDMYISNEATNDKGNILKIAFR